MKLNVTKYLFSVWFALLLLIGNTPMDFIHLFADHHDTVHSGRQDGPVIEQTHHHCAYLSLTLTSFVNDHQAPVILFAAPAVYFTKHVAISASYIQRCIVAVSLRGPPVV